MRDKSDDEPQRDLNEGVGKGTPASLAVAKLKLPSCEASSQMGLAQRGIIRQFAKAEALDDRIMTIRSIGALN